jgi:RHS repeat-associated protein
VSFAAVNSGVAAATAVSSTATQLVVRVPPLAATGPITVTNPRGTATSPVFTVAREQDFQVVISPASVTVYQAASNSASMQLSSIGTKPYTGLVSLSAVGMPAGVTASFSPAASLSSLQTGTVTFAAGAAAVPGSYSITIRGDTKEGGQTLSHSAAIVLNIQASAGLSGVKGRFVTPEGSGISGVIVRADISATPQPQTTTDAAGNFTLLGLPAGTVTLRFDATPANPLYPIWPQTITQPANQILVMEDWIINPPPSADKFSTFVPNSPAEQIIRDPRFPGLQIRIPAGTSIVGWDGVPKSRIAVERLDPDKLPVAAPPIKTKSVYQLYFGTPMGGLPSQPIPVTLPNDLGLEPGMKTPLYYYDGSPMGGSGEWKQGGMGTVSADGSVIVTDAGSGIPRFCGVCGLPCFKAAEDEAPNPPSCDDCQQKYGKPVTLATGQELESAVDLVVDGEVPIVIRRVFNPFDAFAFIANFQQSLGLNWTFGGYDVAMMPFDGDFQIRIVLPGNSRVDFSRDADGKYRQKGYSSFDGAEISKIGGTNPTAIGFLGGGSNPPGSADFLPTCFPNGTYFLSFKDGRQWRFDAAPSATTIRIKGGCLYFLSEMRDAQNRFVQITRSRGKITSIATSSGQSVTFSYSASGVVQSLADNTGRTVTYNHDFVGAKGGFRAFGATTSGMPISRAAVESAAIAAGLSPIVPLRLSSAITPEGTYSYTYEDDPPSLRLGALSFTDGAAGGTPISTASTTCQNVRGGTRLKTIQLPGIPGVFTNYYGPSKRVLRQTWPDGTEIFFKYKVVGGCVPGLISYGAQPSSGAPIAIGSPTTTCQGAGCVRTDSWDGQSVTGGNIVGVEIIDSRGKVFTKDYNSLGLTINETDENGQPVKIVRDPENLNRIRSRTDALGRKTAYEYDLRGNRTKIVDPAGRETTIAYDPTWNKPVSVKRLLADATPIIYQYSYDNVTGVLAASTDPEGNVTTYGYNAAKRLSTIRDPLGHETTIAYDASGNPATITDPLGNSISMISDSAGRITQTTDATGHTTQASYNPLNQLTSITDGKQGLTKFNFDGRNNLQSVVNPLTKTIESYGYDTIGRLTTKTDAKLKAETYSYDGNGNLTSITDRRNQLTTIAYNARNQPDRITYAGGSAQVRAYDAVGRLTEITEGDNAQRMEYDTLDRVTKVVTDSLTGQTTITYEYDALDRRTKRIVSYPGGVAETTVYAYDKASRLSSITQTGVNGTQATTYTWDAASRLSQKLLPNGIKQEFAYDEANRLLSITYKKTDNTLIEQVAYTYDANGQRLSRGTGTATPKDTLFSAAYDEANRMTAITLNPGTANAKSYNLGYDGQGNLVTKQNAVTPSEVTTYVWDARNRLLSISMREGSVTNVASFKYDALGRRIERTVSQGATTQRTQFVYDGIQAIGELIDGRLAATILTGLNIDEVIARTVNVTTATAQTPLATKTYLTDALGSVLAMTNPAQNPELFYAYSGYGETTLLGVDANVPANSNQYTARENDGLVGGTNGGPLYYYRARYYDPVLKRFISEDVVGMLAGPNFYGYVGGSPSNLTDASGNCPWCLAGMAIGMGLNLATQYAANGGNLNLSNIDYGQLLMAGAAGALGGGLGTLTQSIWMNVAGGAAISVARQVASNALNMECDWMKGTLHSGILGGALGGGGAIFGRGAHLLVRALQSARANASLQGMTAGERNLLTGGTITGPFYPPSYVPLGATVGDAVANTISNLDNVIDYFQGRH